MFDFAANRPASAAATRVDHGLVAGTLLATAAGWRAVEDIRSGDEVLTFDGGLQRVVSVVRQRRICGGRAADRSTWPLLVPAGVLGNREEITLLPDQSVLVESDAAEAVFGDPFALVPALALDGFRGICRVPPQAVADVVILRFAQDEVVFANAGALVHCPAAHDLLSDAPASIYASLTLAQADLLVQHLRLEDEGLFDTALALTTFHEAA